jgi:hypothetical protein
MFQKAILWYMFSVPMYVIKHECTCMYKHACTYVNVCLHFTLDIIASFGSVMYTNLTNFIYLINLLR